MPGIVMGGLSGRLFGELLREANPNPNPNPNPYPNPNPNPNPNQVSCCGRRTSTQASRLAPSRCSVPAPC